MAKMGAPTKFKKSHVQELLDFFDIDLYEIQEVETTDKYGNIKKKKIKTPAPMPTVEGFAKHLKVCKSTIYEWAKKDKNFSNALSKCKAWQMNHLIQHSLNGNYNASFARFLAINISEYREQVAEEKDVNVTVNVKKHE